MKFTIHKTAAKACVAVLTQAVGQAITLGLLSGNARSWAEIGLSVLTAVGVYMAPNAAPTP